MVSQGPVGGLGDGAYFSELLPSLVLKGDTLLDTWIFAGDDRRVRHLWSAGRELVRDGRHVARDGVERRFAGVMRRLRAAL